MDAAHAILAFLVAAGLLTVTPGIDTALVLRTSAVEGPRRGIEAAFGICGGVLVWGLAVSVGLGALLAASQAAYEALRVAGALYMLWLGGRLLLAAYRGHAPAGVIPPPRATRSWLLRGFLSNILNPKVGVFYVTFLPLFIPPHANVVGFSLLLACINAAEGLIWFWLLATLTRPLTNLIQNGSMTRALDGITGSVLVAFGIGLFVERR